MPVSYQIYGLLYGDYFELHERLLVSFLRRLPRGTDVSLWCNQVGQRTKDLLNQSTYFSYFSPKNVPKYIAMRQLLSMRPVNSEWLVWFDDDSYFDMGGWEERTTRYIEERRKEQICYFGLQCESEYFPGQWKFIQESTWYKGRQPELVRGQPGIRFILGGYWWLRADVARLIDWPDQRLSHNGGDTLLAEAVRQQGLPMHAFHYGVHVNGAARRGLNELPAGATAIG
jgi:hypothetical protein